MGKQTRSDTRLQESKHDYYMFDNPDQYIAYAHAKGLVIPEAPDFDAQKDFGVTYVKRPEMIPVYSAVFMANGLGQPNTYPKYATALQVATAFDWLSGYIATGGVQSPVNTRFSDSTAFALQLNHQDPNHLNGKSDWDAFNDLQTCKVNTQNGVFSGWADSTPPGTPPVYHYICNGTNGTGTALSTTYANKDNMTVLQNAYPVYSSQAGVFQELIVRMLGSEDQGTPQRASQFTAGSNFQCTTYLVNFVAGINGTGEIPLKTQRPAACPAPDDLQKPYCQKLFNHTGIFPDGNMFNCVLSGQPNEVSMAHDILGNISSLGGNAPNAPVKLKLSQENSNVYIFPDAITAINAFQAAALPNNSQSKLDADEAGTFPLSVYDEVEHTYATKWYTQLLLTNDYTTDTMTQTHVVVHELGHVLDFNSGEKSASSDYSDAMQNDFAKMDYVQPYAATQTPANQLGPCAATIGPLQGADDPLNNNNAFCLAAGGFTVGDDFAANNKKTTNPWLASSILRNLRNPTVLQKNVGGENLGFATYRFYTTSPGWTEWFAESFAMEADSDVHGTSPSPELSRVILNGYFACTGGKTTGVTGWAKSVYLGLDAPVLPAGCVGSSLPAWWSNNSNGHPPTPIEAPDNQ